MLLLQGLLLTSHGVESLPLLVFRGGITHYKQDAIPSDEFAIPAHQLQGTADFHFVDFLCGHFKSSK